jgi:hypothetical protein
MFASQSQSVGPSLDDTSRIESLIEQRRSKLLMQDKAAETQSNLCDKIKSDKPKGIEKRILLLEELDPELFRYIRYLERVQYGVWCYKCENVKNVTDVDFKSVDSVDSVDSAESINFDYTASKLANLDTMVEELAKLRQMTADDLNAVRNDFRAQMDAYIEKSTAAMEQIIQTRVEELSKYVDNLSGAPTLIPYTPSSEMKKLENYFGVDCNDCTNCTNCNDCNECDNVAPSTVNNVSNTTNIENISNTKNTTNIISAGREVVIERSSLSDFLLQ